MYSWSDYYSEMVSRNIGVITEEEQEKLRNSCVAIAGTGGMGGSSALWLTQMGVGRLKLADPDVFEISNINRQFGAMRSTLNKRKIEVISSLLSDMNPEIEIELFPQGITSENVTNFIEGSNVVIDAIDYTQFLNSVILHRESRKKGLYVFLSVAIGFGANLFVFDPNGMTLEEYVGLDPLVSIDRIKDFTIPLKAFCPIVPNYADLEIVNDAASGKIPIPNISIGQAIGTSMMVSEIIQFLLGKNSPTTVPDFLTIDIIDRRFTVSRNE